MDKFFTRAQPVAGEILHKLAANSKPWTEYLRESKGGTEARLGSYSHSFMRPNFASGVGGSEKFEKLGKDWRETGLSGANAWKMYKDALPAHFELHPKDPIVGKDWMKLHEKNPAYLSKFMNGQGMPYSSRYSGLRAGAHSQLLISIERARHLGLLPVWGNPYYHRNNLRKPTPRLSNTTKDHVETYRSQWIENERIKQHFSELKKMTAEVKRARAPGQGAAVMGNLPHFPRVVNRRDIYNHKRFHYAVSHVNPLDCV
eukprot:TRINITY_DN10821_c0_g1_i1.p1 TRINITY_DN10821_c0_g1~~TRINITY_DN10821_c0_g1_i1.p1  ORF type:complete len:258 (+),score=15.28 TRINITY_DN10821_c0_g1_i1:48-821(+)